MPDMEDTNRFDDSCEIEIVDKLSNSVKKTCSANGIVTEKVVVIRREKNLHDGEYCVPRGCLATCDDEVKTAVIDNVISDSKNWSVPVKAVDSDSYNAFRFHLSRPDAFRQVLQQVLFQGSKFGTMVHASSFQSVLVNTVDAVSHNEASPVSLDQLRAIVLAQHVQHLLEAKGHKVLHCRHSDLSSSVSEVLQLCDLDPDRFQGQELQEDFIRRISLDIRTHPCTEIRDNSNNSNISDSSSTNSFEGQNINSGVDRHSSAEYCGIAEKLSILDSKKQETVVFNLQKYLVLHRLPVGKNRFDKNLREVEVVRSSPKLNLVAQVGDLENAWRRVAGGEKCCLHIVSQSQAFSQQKLHLLWQAAGGEHAAHSQAHLVFGPVTTRKSAGVSHKLTALQYFKLRFKELEEASVLKYGSAVEGSGWKKTITSLTVASIKFELLTSVCRNAVKLDLCDPDSTGTHSDNGHGSFVMYNCARLATLLENFNSAVTEGRYPPLPLLSEVDFSTLREEEEWALLFNFIEPYPSLVQQSIETIVPKDGSIQAKIHTHKVSNMLLKLSRWFSSYYSRFHVLGESRSHLLPTMYARLYLLKGLHQVMVNGLTLMGICPLSQL